MGAAEVLEKLDEEVTENDAEEIDVSEVEKDEVDDELAVLFILVET